MKKKFLALLLALAMTLALAACGGGGAAGTIKHSPSIPYLSLRFLGTCLPSH